ncbi:MAG TPA: hypothetical protein VFX98_01165, partial [Longimicrobiaceae bacterium]|nr:hypothetical protein [Longimicrobiaceae bacterium]
MEPMMEAELGRKGRTRAHLPRRSSSRRWCIPPAILREPNEMLEASQILEELDSDVGLLLWQSLRDVTLWAEVPPERREGLFSPDAAHHRLGLLTGAGAEPTVEVSLATLAALVGNPGSA